MRTVILLVFLLSALPAAAVDVFKCKGENGEVSFSNTPCPEKSGGAHYGSYQKAPDDPQQLYAAQREAARIQAKNSGQQFQAPTAPSAREIAADLNDIETEDPRSGLGSAARKIRLDYEYSKKTKADRRAYEQAMERLRASATGSTQTQGITREPDRLAGAAPTIAVEPPPATTTNCRSSGGNIVCFDTNGGATHGKVDAQGNARMDGQRLRRDAAGKLKTKDGTCVKGIYGSCI